MNAGSTFPHQVAGSKPGEDVRATEERIDVINLKMEADGSFKRKASTFRNSIQDDGEFLPEKGQENEETYDC